MKQAEVIAQARRLFPRLPFDCVLDVGANCGQSSTAFATLFPGARIHAFEPASASFDQLRAAVAGEPRVTCHRLALGAEAGDVRVTAFGTSVSNAIVGEGAAVATEPVRRETGDRFCAEHLIERIGYLKIDTEGHDLEVLRGFEATLRDQRIDLLEVEAGMHHHNAKHVPIGDYMAYLAPLGYFLFRVAEQVFERHGRFHLRRANLVFVSDRAVRSNDLPAAAAKAFPAYPIRSGAAPSLSLDMPAALDLPCLPGRFTLRASLRMPTADTPATARLTLAWRADAEGAPIAISTVPARLERAEAERLSVTAPVGLAGLPPGPLHLDAALSTEKGEPLGRIGLAVTLHAPPGDPAVMLRNAGRLDALSFGRLERVAAEADPPGAAVFRLEPPRDLPGALADEADLAALQAVSVNFTGRRWRAGSVRSSGTEVALLRDAVMLGACSAAFTPGGLYGETIHFGTRRPWQTYLAGGATSVAAPGEEAFEAAAILHNEAPHLYFHWHFNTLAGACAVLEWERASGRSAGALVTRPLRRWQAESLRLLGVPADRLREVPRQVWRAGRLLVPMSLLPGDDVPAPMLSMAYARIRDAALGGVAPDGPPMIYVSRLDAPHRRPLLNEAELAERMQRRGFFVFDARNHDYAAQARLFAGARVILAPHGAGLINMGFAAPGAVVGEIFPAYDQPQYFARLALVFGHRYRCMAAPPIAAEGAPRNAWRVDAAAVDGFVDALLAERR